MPTSSRIAKRRELPVRALTEEMARAAWRSLAGGKCGGISEAIKLGEGFCGSVWQNGIPASDDDGAAARIAAPLMVDGALVGIVGVIGPSSVMPRPGYAGEVALVADLGSAALERLGRHA